MKLFLLNKLNRERQYLYSIATVLIVSAICFGLSAVLGHRVVALILLLTVSLLAITFDILPVLVSAALSAFIWDVLFIPPRLILLKTSFY
jgi:two-component system sensor histidine kinase KdpD